MNLKGVLAACVTPWQHGNQVDEASLWRHLEMLIEAGIQGVCVAGSTGEYPRLDRSEYERLVRAAVEITGRRVPVLAGIGHASLDGSLAFAKLAAKAGADALLAPPPIYFPYDQPQILTFYERLVGEAPLPVLLYNIPQFSSGIETATAVRLLTSGPWERRRPACFVGIKESGGSQEMVRTLLTARRDHPFCVLSGFDSDFVWALEQGVDGALSGIAACAPEVILALYRAVRAEDRREAEVQQARVREFIAHTAALPAPVGVRVGLEARGIPVGPHAVPLNEEMESSIRKFALWFEQWLGAAATSP